jgi:23S rRNA pseudouridine2605 synthase
VIAHPDTVWLRRYKVRAHGDITQADLDSLRDGITIDEMEYGPVEARLDRVQGDNVWITMGLREGKNREVKRILEHLGLEVNRLIRLSFGPFQLGDIEPGLVEEVKTKVLKDQLGTKLAEEAGVDFESPVREPIAPFGSPKKRERQERSEQRVERRPERMDRPGRFDRDRRDDRPHARRGDADRPFRAREDERRGRDEAEQKRPARDEVRRSVWRAEEDEATAHKGHKQPRRGADPREARAASAERLHQRVGTIQAEGRKVVVERLVSEPRTEEPRPPRKPRRDADRPAPGGEDRPRRHRDHGGDERPPRRSRDDGFASGRREGGERPYRARGEGEDRPRRPRPAGDRPFRSRSEDGDRPRRPRPEGDRPFRSRGGDDRPRRGPPRGEGPSRGGPRGGAKGPPRGRRS